MFLALEDSISERVTKCLLPQLTGEERRQLAKRGTNNAKAFEAYMRGRFFWNQFTPEAFAKAIESFEKAVDLDPNYALAYVGIADFYTWATIYGLFPPTNSSPKIFAAASRALEIDDTWAKLMHRSDFIIQTIGIGRKPRNTIAGYRIKSELFACTRMAGFAFCRQRGVSKKALRK